MGSWLANHGAWHARPSISDDASVLASFQTFVRGLHYDACRPYTHSRTSPTSSALTRKRQQNTSAQHK